MDHRHNRNQNRTPQVKEENAIVLDVLVNNDSFKSSETVQAVGTKAYTLLELTPKQGAILKAGDKVYIGDGKRDDIQYIKRSIPLEELSGGAKSELLFTLKELILERESDFVNFFNNAGPVTIRKHSLELIEGVGKKHVQTILDERDEKFFENFEDISSRCTFLADPAKALAQRIMDELDDPNEFKLFTRR